MTLDSASNPSTVETIPTLDLKAQYLSIQEEIKSAIDKVLESQHFILGPEVEGLEREIAAYVDSGFGVGVASGTDALMLALKACDIGPGDEVLCPSFTFVATANAISLLGAEQVFIDIDPITFAIDQFGGHRLGEGWVQRMLGIVDASVRPITHGMVTLTSGSLAWFFGRPEIVVVGLLRKPGRQSPRVALHDDERWV